MEKTCDTCKYKETAGCMVDPCFPCMQTHCMFTGEEVPQYSHWTDENKSWEEIKTEDNAERAEIRAFLDDIWENNPEFKKLTDDFIAGQKNSLENHTKRLREEEQERMKFHDQDS